ncbi:hypothetical protein I7I50_08354 [Histoplasma capsulatum G186AR]|uniref:Secreted protein n=1 Tax=Ajellomyces capsulatus TaxID=5037 RepID=A0A8H7YPZ7_AJECA|nr:hypothetical protein I7I52_05870 [Histoplasma capsulatum]QSS73548.1 hypothetical protein I7I50_08354 [Histoplasma capsulatum G186AR]
MVNCFHSLSMLCAVAVVWMCVDVCGCVCVCVYLCFSVCSQCPFQGLVAVTQRCLQKSAGVWVWPRSELICPIRAKAVSWHLVVSIVCPLSVRVGDWYYDGGDDDDNGNYIIIESSVVCSSLLTCGGSRWEVM